MTRTATLTTCCNTYHFLIFCTFCRAVAAATPQPEQQPFPSSSRFLSLQPQPPTSSHKKPGGTRVLAAVTGKYWNGHVPFALQTIHSTAGPHPAATTTAAGVSAVPTADSHRPDFPTGPQYQRRVSAGVLIQRLFHRRVKPTTHGMTTTHTISSQ